MTTRVKLHNLPVFSSIRPVRGNRLGGKGVGWPRRPHRILPRFARQLPAMPMMAIFLFRAWCLVAGQSPLIHVRAAEFRSPAEDYQ